MFGDEAVPAPFLNRPRRRTTACGSSAHNNSLTVQLLVLTLRLSWQLPMSRTQFWTLNFAGGACGLLIALDVVLSYLNGALNQSVVATQKQFNQAQQLQNTTQNLVGRIAQAGQHESALQELLAKHDFRIVVNTNQPPKPAP